MRVASYNIHRGIGRDGRYDPARILRVLREVDADVVALQEVDFGRSDQDEILAWLGMSLRMTAVPGPVRTDANGDYGNAFLTKFPVERVRQWDLSVGAHEARGALDVDMLCQGTLFRVVTTHLGLWPLERPLQAARLLERLRGDRRNLTILMGDLNEWQIWGKSLRVFRRVFGSPAAPSTFPSGWPLIPLDRVWVSPASALLDVQAHRSEQSRTASDHLPVKADILFSGKIPQPLPRLARKSAGPHIR